MELTKRYLGLPLELMKTMVLLYHHRNLKQVGLILNKSESAISREVSKLRYHFNDPIFIRSAQGMELTPLVLNLAPQIETLYNQIALSIEQASNTNCDLSQYDKPILIALNSYIYQNFAAKLTDVLLQSFPQATIHVQRWDNQTLSHISKGVVDFGVHFDELESGKDISQRELSRYQVSLAMHPDIEADNLHDALEHRMVITRLPYWNEHRYRLFETLNIEPKKLVYVDSLHTACDLIKRTPAVSFLPDFIYQQQNVKILNLQQDIHYHLSSYFKQTYRAEPLIVRLHELIKSVMGNETQRLGG